MRQIGGDRIEPRATSVPKPALYQADKPRGTVFVRRERALSAGSGAGRPSEISDSALVSANRLDGRRISSSSPISTGRE